MRTVFFLVSTRNMCALGVEGFHCPAVKYKWLKKENHLSPGLRHQPGILSYTNRPRLRNRKVKKLLGWGSSKIMREIK